MNENFSRKEEKTAPYNKAALCENKWDTVADGYRKWWRDIEEQVHEVSNLLIEMAGQAGYRVLDIATGYGEPAISAAQRVRAAAGGYVQATDISCQMLEIALPHMDYKML